METPKHFGKIVFFDGICVLCNRSVDFLMKKDRRGQLKFASLQSEFAIDFLAPHLEPGQKKDSIIYFEKGILFTKSSAVLKIAGHLVLPYRAFSILRFIPESWRDLIYDAVARNRFKWFGKKEHCRVPDEETRDRIIA